MFKTKTIQPSSKFIKLFEKTEKVQEEALEVLADATGFEKEWCRKNLKKAFSYLGEDTKKELDHKSLYAQVLKQKLWADFYFQEFDQIKEYLSNGSKIKYNRKKKVVEVIDSLEIKQKLTDALANIKQQLKDLVGDS